MKPGPSPHLSWDELGCFNRLGRQWEGFAPGELIERYPLDWRFDRALQLAATFEDIRVALGNKPIAINSAYRTSAYNRAVSGAKLSQHVSGRALDIRHPSVKPAAVYAAIRAMAAAGKLPLLGGVGQYSKFVHIDVRPRVNGRLAVWFGAGIGSREDRV